MPRFSRTYSGELDGVRARRVEVEVDMHAGLHSFTIVGLADKALSEAKERVEAALKNSGAKPPSRENRKIIVNLAPADVKKNGSQYDLAIALGYLRATSQISDFPAEGKVFAGELALDGSVRAVRGTVNIARMAASNGMREAYVPAENAKDAAMVKDIAVFPVTTLSTLIAHLEGRILIVPCESAASAPDTRQAAADFADIRGQAHAKRALLIAACGGHHALMAGPPGAGKTMLAQALPGILPRLSHDEAIEVLEIYSASGIRHDGHRPFRAPHHTASAPSVVGGGSGPRPGEISLAHKGVLFMDELPEFRRDVLESLREPLENGRISVARSRGTVSFPARFMLVAAMNPCPCGYRGDPGRECSCTAHEVARYAKRVSGPIMDRIDMQVRVPRAELAELSSKRGSGESSATLREKVLRVRELQLERQGCLNAELSSKKCAALPMDASAEAFLKKAWTGTLLSARGYYRALKVAQTVADMEGASELSERHLAEAFGYRVRE